MVAAGTLPRPSEDVIFDGNLIDLDRVLGFVDTQHIVYAEAFADNDVAKSGYLAMHLRGTALDWHAALVQTAQGAARMTDYAAYLNALKAQFSYDPATIQAGAQTELMSLRQAGMFKELPEFLNQLDTLTARSGMISDTTKLTLLYDKLDKYYSEALITKGSGFVRYRDARAWLLSVYARTPQNGVKAEDKRSKARCKKCGKRGHTGTECRSKN